MDNKFDSVFAELMKLIDKVSHEKTGVAKDIPKETQGRIREMEGIITKFIQMNEDFLKESGYNLNKLLDPDFIEKNLNPEQQRFFKRIEEFIKKTERYQFFLGQAINNRLAEGGNKASLDKNKDDTVKKKKMRKHLKRFRRLEGDGNRFI